METSPHDSPKTKHNGLRNAVLFIAFMVGTLIVLEFFAARYLPEIETYSELKNKNAFLDKIRLYKGRSAYMSFYDVSPYLPFTLPKDRKAFHRYDEFHVIYETNSLGYRGEFPRRIEKDPGKKRVLFLGDSFTFGFGNNLSDTFVHKIQEKLGRKKFEVINAAYHAALSPDSYYAYLRKEGEFLDPDLIVVVIYSDNDIRDIAENRWLELDDRGLPVNISTLRNFTDYKFRYINFQKNELYPWNYRIPVLRDSNAFVGLTNIYNRRVWPEQYAFINGYADGRFINTLGGKPVVREEAKRKFEKTILGIDAFAKKKNIDCVFFVIPSSRSLMPDVQEYSVYFDHHREVVDIFLRNKNLNHLDMYPHMTVDDYFKTDGHFNPSGNSNAAEIIWSHLKENKYLEKISQRKAGAFTGKPEIMGG